jgi:sugar lactone lactonase YvrE
MRRYRHSLLCLAVVLSAGLGFASPAGAQLIHTVAGGGPNNIPAISASVQPFGVAVDLNGNTYITAGNQQRVFKIDPSGILTVVAGAGSYGYNGDGITATTAELDYPTGVAVDSSGNIYIADQENHRIRKVDGTSGLISTVAGTGTAGYNGDGITAITAELYYPEGVAVDSSGNIYIADEGNQRIRKVDGTSGLISTVAGTGTGGYNGDGITAITAELYYPFGVAVNSSGNIYIGDYGNQRIRKVDGTSGLISTVAGTGTYGYNGDGITATTAELGYPIGVAVDSSGNIYIADYQNHRIRKVNGTSGPPRKGICPRDLSPQKMDYYPLRTNSATWSSTNTSAATTSNAAGSNGLATGVSSGSTTITATSASVSGTSNLTIQ